VGHGDLFNDDGGTVAMPEKIPPPDIDSPPPFLGRWRNVYLLVIGELALTVAAFYALTRWAS